MTIPFVDALNAIKFFAYHVFGRDSEEALFAYDQATERIDWGLTDINIEKLTRLIQSESLVRIANLPTNLISAAENEGNRRTRLRFSNLAAAIALQLELLLRPGDLVKTVFDETGMPIVRVYHVETVGIASLSDYTKDVLARRRVVLGEIDKLSHRLFDGHGHGGHQLERAVSMAVQRIAREYGVPDLTLQRLRDIGAILMLLDNKKAVRRVAALLDVVNVDQIEKRYRPFLA